MTRAQRLAQDLAAVTPEDRERVRACVLSVLEFFADLRSERSMLLTGRDEKGAGR